MAKYIELAATHHFVPVAIECTGVFEPQELYMHPFKPFHLHAIYAFLCMYNIIVVYCSCDVTHTFNLSLHIILPLLDMYAVY